MTNSKDRIAIALNGGKSDRIPLVDIFNMNYLMKEIGGNYKGFNIDLLEKVIEFQEEIGHDPVLYLHSFQEPEMVKLPESFMKWKNEDTKDWNIEEKVVIDQSGHQVIEREYKTPVGSMKSVLRREKQQAWVLEHPLKNRDDIRLLKYRPDPEKIETTILKELIEKSKERAFFTIGIPSVWQEGCAMRGLSNMIYDVYDNPDWVKEYFEILMENSIKTAKMLGKLGIDSIFVNESYAGLGISKDMYREFILLYDKKIIEAANSAGMITSLHICGKCNALLEDMADSGVTCIEPLAPFDYAGDADLADAKMRIGKKVGIWGGFRERVLNEDKETVKKEALRCIKAAGEGGGYVLRGTGQIYDAKIENLKYLRELVEEYGRY